MPSLPSPICPSSWILIVDPTRDIIHAQIINGLDLGCSFLWDPCLNEVGAWKTLRFYFRQNWWLSSSRPCGNFPRKQTACTFHHCGSQAYLICICTSKAHNSGKFGFAIDAPCREKLFMCYRNTGDVVIKHQYFFFV